MPTALTVFFANAASATLTSAEKLYTISGTPSVATPKTQLDTATGYGEIIAKGTTSAWSALGSIGAPTGNGLFLDASTLDGQQLVAGSWSANVRTGLNTTGTATIDIYVRAYKYSGGVYTNIITMSLTGNALSGSVQSTYALSGSTASATNFATGDKLYIDIWFNVTANTSATGQQFRLNNVSTDTTGLTGNSTAQVVTPGYQVSSGGTAGPPTLSPTSLSFSDTVGGTGPATQTSTLTNTGSASGSYTTSISYGSGSGWLSVSPSSGTLGASATQSLTFTCTTGSLAAGTYTATLTATLGGSNATVNVTFTVNAATAPVIAVSPSSLSFSATVGGSNPASQTATLSNTGTASGSWTSSIAYGSGAGWLGLSPTSGTLAVSATQNVTHSILIAGLAAGTYTATVTYTMTGYNSVTVAITLAIAPASTSNPTLSVTIAGNAVSIRDDNRFELDDSINSASTFMCTIGDLSGTQRFTRGQRVTITDSVRGTLYTGFVMTSVATAFPPQAYVESYVSCVDNHYLPDKRTYQGMEYTNQYAGVIFADMMSSLSAEGITAQYASLRETTQANFAAGTLSNVVSSTNVSDGDLELAASGTAVSHTETFSAGTLTNTQVVSGALQLQSGNVLKLTGTSSQGVSGSSGTTNNYAYVEIWSGSVAIASGDYLQYDCWISSTSPQIASAVDGICTDGSNLRDVSSPTTMNDQNGFWMHPKTDLSGYANDQWYTRQIVLSNAASKTLSKVTVAFEGDSNGNYTSYFRNVSLYSSGGTLKQSFFSTSLSGAVTTLSNVGYANVMLSVVSAYQQSGIRVSPSTSISSVGIVQSSLISWQATVPTGTAFVEEVSIDSGATWQACTRNQPLPTLIAGANASGFSIYTRQRLMITGTSPEVTPVLTSQIWSVQPSYNATKTDVLHIEQTSTDFSGGTNTNIQVNGANQMSLQGNWRTWDDALVTSQTYFGVGGHGTIAKQCNVTVTGNGNVGVSQLDFAGTWQNFTAEIDMSVSSHGNVSFTYRTTNQGSGNNSGAYAVDINPSTLLFGYGANNGASTSQTYHSLGSASLFLSGTALKVRLKVVVSGSNHRIYIDDVLYFNVTDSTYTAAGKFGLRFLNSDSVTPGTYTAFFDNFGVMNSYTGSHLTNAISISAIGTVGNSLVQWDADIPASGTIVVESSFDASTWQTCTNGQPLPQLPAGTVNSHSSLYIRATLTTGNAAASAVTGRDGNVYLTPTIHGLTVWIANQLNASGNRIGPVLSISNLGRIGSTLVAWNANLPTGTTLGVDARVDSGSWVDVTASNGGTVPGLSGQATPTIDDFVSNTSANYTSTFRTGGSAATWTYDTTNGRITATSGSKALYVNNLLSCGDVSVTIDMDESDTGGCIWHYTSATSFYELVIQDASSTGGSPNTIALFSVKSGTRTQLASTTIAFTRGTFHRFQTTMSGNTITTVMDGTTLWNYTDSSALTTGKCGLRSDGGTARWYQLYMQPLGDLAFTHTIQMRLRLATTNPLVSPQVLNTTLAAFGNSIAVGALIPQTSYQNKYISANADDLAKQSGYWWYLDKNKTPYFLPTNGLLAPWIASDNPGDFLYANITMTNQSDLYHNRHIVTNVLQTTTINESRIGDGYSQSWTFGYEWNSAPTITVNGVPAVVGIKGVDTGKQFYWKQGDPTITEDASQPVYDNSTVLTFVGTGQYLTEAVADNTTAQTALAALEGSSGIVEVVEDGTGLSYAAGLAKAQALVAQYSVFGQELQADTRRIGLAPGQLLSVYLPEFGCYGTQFLVRSIKTRIQQENGGYQPIFTIDAISGVDAGDWTKLYLKQ